jgi:hypothetical protein
LPNNEGKCVPHACFIYFEAYEYLHSCPTVSLFWNGSWQVTIYSNVQKQRDVLKRVLQCSSSFRISFFLNFNSLSSVIFGATAVYPSSGFDAGAALAACQNEK